MQKGNYLIAFTTHPAPSSPRGGSDTSPFGLCFGGAVHVSVISIAFSPLDSNRSGKICWAWRGIAWRDNNWGCLGLGVYAIVVSAMREWKWGGMERRPMTKRCVAKTQVGQKDLFVSRLFVLVA
jgi:hypothetical protein